MMKHSFHFLLVCERYRQTEKYYPFPTISFYLERIKKFSEPPGGKKKRGNWERLEVVAKKGLFFSVSSSRFVTAWICLYR